MVLKLNLKAHEKCIIGGAAVQNGNYQNPSERQRGHAVEVVAEVEVVPGMDVGAVQALKGLPVSDDLGVAKTIGMTCSESHGLFYFPCSAGWPESIARKS